MSQGNEAVPTASQLSRPLDQRDRDLLRRTLSYMGCPSVLTGEERRELLLEVQDRLDEALAAATDDQLTPEELEAQHKGSW